MTGLYAPQYHDGHRVIWIAALVCAAAVNLAAQVAIIEHVVPTAESFPDSIVRGPDGALWFTEYGANKIGRITPAGMFSEFTVPTPNSAPYGITVGPDGAIWFTEYFENKIGRIANGAIIEYTIPTANSFPARITTGPDGALWFTEFNAHKIGRITTQGVISEFNLPEGSYPVGIARGPDGNLWFTENSANKIGRITTAGALTEFPIPTSSSSPQEITAGPDGALWFTEQSGNKIGRITVSGAITEFNTAGGPIGITAGADGALWFTQHHGAKIGRITTAGAITEYPAPTPGFLAGITIGPQGVLWFAENRANRIGQVVYQTATLTTAPTTGIPGVGVTLSGAGFAPGETVNIGDNLGLWGSRTADTGGAFQITGLVRPGPFGPNSYVALGASSTKLAVAKFSVTPRLFATPSIVRPGDRVTITALGMHPGDSVDVYVADVFIDTGRTDRHGTMAGNNAVRFRVPDGVPPGTYPVTAIGDDVLTAETTLIVQ